jgi:hypothetical protein
MYKAIDAAKSPDEYEGIFQKYAGQDQALDISHQRQQAAFGYEQQGRIDSANYRAVGEDQTASMAGKGAGMMAQLATAQTEDQPKMIAADVAELQADKAAALRPTHYGRAWNPALEAPGGPGDAAAIEHRYSKDPQKDKAHWVAESAGERTTRIAAQDKQRATINRDKQGLSKAQAGLAGDKLKASHGNRAAAGRIGADQKAVAGLSATLSTDQGQLAKIASTRNGHMTDPNAPQHGGPSRDTKDLLGAIDKLIAAIKDMHGTVAKGGSSIVRY